MMDLPIVMAAPQIAKPREFETRIKDYSSEPRAFFKTAARMTAPDAA
jgi:hypothetical protein